MKFFEVLGKILDFIRDILVGVVILTIIFVIGIIFGFIVLADGVFDLFNTNKDQQMNNDDIDK